MIINTFAADEDGVITAYMCKTDFECEAGAAMSGTEIYPSVEDLKRNRKCVEQCGIVEVRVYASRIVQESDYP